MLVAAILLAFAVFAVWPGLDLWMTGLFYDPVRGFAGLDTGPANTVRLAIWHLSELMLLLSVAALAAGLWTRAAVLGVPRKVWAFIALLYLLAPGLLVDAILKRVWGRARPADVTQFGGVLRFTPPNEIAHQCSKNCSFVAGEMAGAVALAVALAMILHHLRPRLPAWVHRCGMVLVVVLPAYSGFQRIAAGRHFLSDVIFATLVVLLVAVGLRAWMFQPARP